MLLVRRVDQRGNAILGFTAAKDWGVVYIAGSDIGRGAAAKVLMLEPQGSVRPAGLGGGMLGGLECWSVRRRR